MRFPTKSALFLSLSVVSIASADPIISIERVAGDDAVSKWAGTSLPAPVKDDLAQSAKFRIVDGQADLNSGDVSLLHDGKLPDEEDSPHDNFFFAAGTDGGRLAIDLGAAKPVAQVNTYSWHGNSRAPQVYTLYAADGAANGFDASPKEGTDPAKLGWTLLANVDTRAQGEGGQHAVSVGSVGANAAPRRSAPSAIC
ncbi:MAG: hypothetical protein QM770_20030 [Tepidisphaeraceae bacterium]